MDLESLRHEMSAMEVELVHVRSQNAVLRDDFDLNGQAGRATREN